MSSRSRVGFDDQDYYRESQVRIRERSRSRERLPNFLRDDYRRSEAGPLVLRQREVETAERRRRSPSPVRIQETRIVRARSVSPPRRAESDVRFRTVVREPSRGPDMERLRTRIVERQRSPSSSPEPRVRARIVERGRSPSPIRERERIRIVDREKETIRPRTPSPVPPPVPQVIQGPIIERQVITHYTDVDHGVVTLRPPSPPPQPRRRDVERDTEIDIYTSRRETEVDIHKRSRSRSRVRGRSRSRSRERISHPHTHSHEHKGILVHSDKRHLHVDIDSHSHTHMHGGRRAHSEAPPRRDYDEAREITSRIDSRGRIGEAYHGATKDWTIVDVPPGTERVRMDGVGGGSAEVTWQKYSGVRRSRFIPDRDEPSVVSATTSASDRHLDDSRRSSRLSVSIYDKDTRERDIDVEKVTDKRVSIRKPQRSEMWTEITKDLVIREAIEEMGYEYEETEYFFYIMTYLKYDDVLQLVQLSDAVRQARRDRARELQWDRTYRDYDREYHIHAHTHRHRDSSRRRRYDSDYDDDRTFEHEVTYERRGSKLYV